MSKEIGEELVWGNLSQLYNTTIIDKLENSAQLFEKVYSRQVSLLEHFIFYTLAKRDYRPISAKSYFEDEIMDHYSNEDDWVDEITHHPLSYEEEVLPGKLSDFGIDRLIESRTSCICWRLATDWDLEFCAPKSSSTDLIVTIISDWEEDIIASPEDLGKPAVSEDESEPGTLAGLYIQRYEESVAKGRGHFFVASPMHIKKKESKFGKVSKELERFSGKRLLTPKEFLGEMIPDDSKRRKVREEWTNIRNRALNEFRSRFSVEELIKREENQWLEFKSTLRHPVKRKDDKKISDKVERAVAKTVAGFMNEDGGTLLIGVKDDGEIFGLEEDYETLKKSDRDGFELKLKQILKNYLGKKHLHRYDTYFEEIESKDVCKLSAESSPKPVYLKSDNKEEFYVRVGNETVPYSHSEAVEYIEEKKEKGEYTVK